MSGLQGTHQCTMLCYQVDLADAQATRVCTHACTGLIESSGACVQSVLLYGQVHHSQDKDTGRVQPFTEAGRWWGPPFTDTGPWSGPPIHGGRTGGLITIHRIRPGPRGAEGRLSCQSLPSQLARHAYRDEGGLTAGLHVLHAVESAHRSMHRRRRDQGIRRLWLFG